MKETPLNEAMTKVEPSHLALDLASLTISEHVEATKDQSEDSSSDEDNNKDEYICDKFPDDDEKEVDSRCLIYVEFVLCDLHFILYFFHASLLDNPDHWIPREIDARVSV